MVRDFQAEIAKREEEIAAIKREQQAFESQTPDQMLAANLHSALCRWNHEDQCGWFYEIHKAIDDWNGSTHRSWLAKADNVRKLLPGLDDQTIVKVTAAIRSI